MKSSSRYSMVLFLLLVVISTIASSSSTTNNEEQQADVFMVVDDAGTGMTPKNRVQIGRFEIGKGKVLTLARPAQNCIDIYQPCGALDWCCEGLSCTGIIEGECRNNAFCHGFGESCDPIHPCCQPNTCDATIYGITSGTCVSPS